jgi:hypothetical protein
MEAVKWEDAVPSEELCFCRFPEDGEEGDGGGAQNPFDARTTAGGMVMRPCLKQSCDTTMARSDIWAQLV